MTIYLDVVLLENLCMNYIILFATGYIMKLKMKQKHKDLNLYGKYLLNEESLFIPNNKEIIKKEIK